MMKTMSMSASESARRIRWIAIVVSMFLLAGAAFLLTITSPSSQAAEIDGTEDVVAVENVKDMIPQPINAPEPKEQAEPTDETVGYDSAGSGVWFKDEQDAKPEAPVAPEQAAREEAARQYKESQAQESRKMMDASAADRKRMEEERQAAAAAALATQSPSTLRIFGEDIPYIYSYNVVSAPNKGCGIWKGVDDVNDGDYTYFVGHNPGDFYNVMNLTPGNVVSLRDANGNSREYTVHDVFTIPQRTTFQQIQERVEGHGESIIMQTCCGDNVNVRVVVAW